MGGGGLMHNIASFALCIGIDAKHCLNVYTTFTNFSTKYLVMCKVYADVGVIKVLRHVRPSICKIIHSLKTCR